MKQLILAVAILMTMNCGQALLSSRMELQFELIQSSGQMLDEFTVYGDSHGDHYYRLKKWLLDVRNTPVMEDPALQETIHALGATWCIGPEMCAIAIDSDTPMNTQYSTLLHEAVHSIYMPDDAGEREILAETVAYEAARLVGLNTARESMSYFSAFNEKSRYRTWRKYEDFVKKWSEELAKVSKGEG